MSAIHVFVGRRIRAERHLRGLSLEELASAVGTSAGYLQQIEVAKKTPSLQKIQDIADALYIPVSRLFHGAEAKTAPEPYVGKLAALVKDADGPRRKTILRVVKEIARKP